MKNNPDVLNPAEALQTKSSSLGKASKKKMDVAAKHPFVHRPKITSIDKVQIAFMSVTIAPLRLIVVAILVTVTWLLATLALLGRSDADSKQPMSGWRSYLRPLVVLSARSVYFVCGFHWISVRGTQAPAAVAPILVLAPHTCYFDSLPVSFLNLSSVVTRASSENVFMFGTLTKFTQPIFVRREDPNSRQQAIQDIQQRAQSKGKWPQILIFPEGTCTSGTALISFKPGAFYPGLPVQPVSLRYINKMNTIPWTWDGPDALGVLWLTLCQFNTSLEMEFLPVYYPSPEEVKDVTLFARNVRAKMAESLGVPVTDDTYEDCQLSSYTSQLDLPIMTRLSQSRKLCKKLRLDMRNGKSTQLLDRLCDIVTSKSTQVTLDEFATCLELPVCDTMKEMFALYDKKECGQLDLREYAMAMCLLTRQPTEIEDIMKLAFQVFDHGSKGKVTTDELSGILHVICGVDNIQAQQLLDELTTSGKQTVTYSDLETYIEARPEFSQLFACTQRPTSVLESLTCVAIGDTAKRKVA
ncbi:Lysophosphatidylcholine acyltransferase 1 [Lamellibrachia satsuma]|nr:Lysophosphatidylcholine acyltransferase 1 [Lamellibrachia satsuma]